MNNISILPFTSFAILAATMMQPAYAEDEYALSNKQYVISLGGGGKIKSKYPGSDSLVFSPWPIIDVTRFYLPGVGQVADGKVERRGFGLFPSFDFTGKRQASDSSDLIGTNEVDWAFEFGLGARYRYDWVQGSVELRQGFNGHNGQVAEFGIDFFANPVDKVELVFGPRASWASKDYMQTYFGVTAAEAAAPGSRLAAYSSAAGFKTVGLEASASYAWSERVTFQMQGGWNRFVANAADSPIVKTGSKNEFTIGMGLTYRFDFDLFK